jgi:hypothetical protein
VLAAACSTDRPGDPTPIGGSPLETLVPTGELTLSPENAGGQDEDPTLLRAADGTLYAAWYSNRNGTQADGVEDREIFLARSRDGRTWSDPPVQVTRHSRFAFYPSLAQGGDGRFHLAWWRVIPTPEGCVPGVDCAGGTINRIVYKSSPTGVDWDLDQDVTIAQGPGDWLPSIVFDRVASRLLVYFASPVRDAAGRVDLSDGTSRIYVVVNDGAGWSAPRRLAGMNPDTSHNTYPHVVQRDDGLFVMAWTRYDASAPFDVLRVIQEPSTDTMMATSSDGIHWSAPVAVSDDASNAAVDVFPHLYVDQEHTLSALWITTAGAPSGRSVERPVGDSGLGPLAARPEIAGYSGRILATATPGIYWGAWVSGPAGTQKIRYRFFTR